MSFWKTVWAVMVGMFFLQVVNGFTMYWFYRWIG